MSANLEQNRLIAANSFGVSSIDLSSGDRSVISTFEFPPELSSGLAFIGTLFAPAILSENEERLFTISTFADALFETNLTSQESQLIINTDENDLLSLSSVTAIALDADETRLFMTTTTLTPELFSVDLNSGTLASLTDLTGQLQFLGRPFLFFDAIENRLVFSGFLPNDSFGGPNGFNLLALSLSDLSI